MYTTEERLVNFNTAIEIIENETQKNDWNNEKNRTKADMWNSIKLPKKHIFQFQKEKREGKNNWLKSDPFFFTFDEHLESTEPKISINWNNNEIRPYQYVS